MNNWATPEALIQLEKLGGEAGDASDQGEKKSYKQITAGRPRVSADLGFI